MSDLVVIVPSRGRPANIARLWQAWSDTGAHADLVVALDVDDPTALDYPAIDASNATISIGARLGLVGTLNREADIALRGGWRHIGFMGDDQLPRTAGWDKFISDALDDLGAGIAYGNDLFQGAALPTAVFLTADIVAALGYMCPPGFRHLYIDNVWKAWGDGICRIRYLDDVIIEHMHPQGGKADWDDGYRRVNAGDVWEHDSREWERYKTEDLPADLEKLRGLL